MHESLFNELREKAEKPGSPYTKIHATARDEKLGLTLIVCLSRKSLLSKKAAAKIQKWCAE